MNSTARAPHGNADSSAVILIAVMVLALASFGSGLSQRLTDALLPHLSAEFGLSLGAVSWVITCFTIGYAACQLFFGPVGDRHGKYLVIRRRGHGLVGITHRHARHDCHCVGGRIADGAQFRAAETPARQLPGRRNFG